MPNTARRTDLATRAADALSDLDGYLKDASPEVAGILRPHRNWLTDIGSFWLATPMKGEDHEMWWLAEADRHLTMTLAQIASIREKIDAAGGPRHAQIVGR
jgi:hypothetical protein